MQKWGARTRGDGFLRTFARLPQARSGCGRGGTVHRRCGVLCGIQSMKPMKYSRPWRYFLPLFLAVLTACHDKGDVPGPPAGDVRRTVVVYMVAQNSMGDRLQQARDSAELVQGLPMMRADDRLLLYIDDARLPRLYELRAGQREPELVRSWTEDVCSADPAVLADVLGWAAARCPSREYGLVMWSHGSGWIPASNKDYAVAPLSFGIDVGPGGTGDRGPDGAPGAQMDVADMAGAIASAGVHLRYVFFDACLMQSLETAYALRDVADYVIGAPISTPMAGAFYMNQMGAGLFADDPADIARTYFADASGWALQDEYGDTGMVLSAIRTDRLEAVAAALRDAWPRSALVGRRSPDMTPVLSYAPYGAMYYFRPHCYDAGEAMRQLLAPEDYARFAAALDEAVTYRAATARFYFSGWNGYKEVDPERFSGVSMFIPQTVYTTNAALCAHGDLNEAFRHTAWYAAAGWAATGW